MLERTARWRRAGMQVTSITACRLGAAQFVASAADDAASTSIGCLDLRTTAVLDDIGDG